ncbi:MAG: MBL fold metallo-hydrolase [Rectinema sp.]
MRLYQHYSIYGFSNSYLVGNDETGEALIVDPAEVTPAMIHQIESNSYRLDAVLITHGHIHHIRGLKTLSRIYADCTRYASSAKVLGLPCRALRDGERFLAAGFEVDAIAMPGHSQDSMVFRVDDLLFTGDAIHAGMIGKTTSSLNFESLARRLRERLLTFPDDNIVLPGHGPPSTIGTERRFNVGLQPGFAESLHPRYDFFV